MQQSIQGNTAYPAPRNGSYENVARITRRQKLVCGVGINDSETQIATSIRVNGKPKLVWKCPAYTAWSDMLTRCYSAKFHSRYPSYVGCSVADEWRTFSAFRKWIAQQDHLGCHLDKDLLVPGNRVYCAETCALISPELNNFLTESTATRGRLPIGAYLHKQGRYEAQCRNPFTRRNEHLGLYESAEAAHQAWRTRKHEHACAYAEIQADPRVARALRSRYLAWGVLSTHDKALKGVA